VSRSGPEPLTSPAADTEQPGAAPVTPKRRRSFLAELPVLMLIAFGLALVLKTFLIQAFFIPSRSMEPTLLIGDRVLVNKVVYDVRDPRRGEIVVFTHSDVVPPPDDGDSSLLERILRAPAAALGLGQPGQKDFIKRIIGLPGDVVEVRRGVVYVNGVELPEAETIHGGYLSVRDNGDFGPVTVRPGHYFMMGDNRPNSDDSRASLGQIPREELVGRAFVIIWPPDNIGVLSRAEYNSSPAQASLSPGLGGVASRVLGSVADEDQHAEPVSG